LTGDQLNAYRERICADDVEEPTLDVLRQIVWLHQLAIPFENLDISWCRRPIGLATDAIVEKLVKRRRGGYCYEQNGLLAAVLMTIGFDVTLGYATWHTDDGTDGQPFDHLVLQVMVPGIDHPWLADVGFGRDSPPCPVALVNRMQTIHEPTGTAFRPEPARIDDRQWSIFWNGPESDWNLLYHLDLRPRRMHDYEQRNHYQQFAEESVFQNGLLCSRRLPDGRVTLAKDRLIVTRNGHREEQPLHTVEAQRAVLKEWFGIDTGDCAP
jgi:N-hydroxyarylamine O-acetyltransferase